jgi:hypothetical protein
VGRALRKRFGMTGAAGIGSAAATFGLVAGGCSAARGQQARRTACARRASRSASNATTALATAPRQRPAHRRSRHRHRFSSSAPAIAARPRRSRNGRPTRGSRSRPSCGCCSSGSCCATCCPAARIHEIDQAALDFRRRGGAVAVSRGGTHDAAPVGARRPRAAMLVDPRRADRAHVRVRDAGDRSSHGTRLRRCAASPQRNAASARGDADGDGEHGRHSRAVTVTPCVRS